MGEETECEHTVLTKRCMYCGKEMAPVDGLGNTGESSGICSDCLTRELATIRANPPKK